MTSHETGQAKPETRDGRKLLMGMLTERKGRLAVIVVTMSICGVAMMLVPFFIESIIDDGIAELDMSAVVTNVAILFALNMSMGVAMGVGQFQISQLASESVANVRKTVTDHVFALPPQQLVNINKAQIISRIGSDAAALDAALRSVLPNAISCAIIFFGSLAGMFFLDATLALIVLPAIALMAGATVVYRKLANKPLAEQRVQVGDLTGTIKSIIENHELIDDYGQRDRARTQFVDSNRLLIATSLRAAFVSSWFSPSSLWFSMLGTGAVIVSGGTAVVNGNLEIGVLVAFYMYLQLLNVPLGTFGQLMGYYQGAVVAGQRLHAAVSTGEIEIAVGGDPLVISRGDIEVRDLTFAYGPTPVFDRLSHTIPGGTASALDSRAGSGSSTLGKLLVRFSEPESGSILIDGVDIRDVSLESLRTQIVYLPPHPDLVQGTVASNLLMNRPGSTEDVKAALANTGAGQFIGKLPDGVDTAVDESGKGLSKGATAALMIARASFGNPKIIVVDRTLDSLDQVTSLSIFEALRSAFVGRTLILVSRHRYLTDCTDGEISLPRLAGESTR